MAKRLSINQEVKLLRLLKNAKQIGGGSSRLTFIHPFDETKVVKLAVGTRSFAQNGLEVRLWTSTHSNFLARIFEYGRFCIVMERAVQCFDEDAFYDGDMEDNEDFMNAVCWLERHNGETSDNYQIGQMSDGRFAAYDYGFTTHGFRGQCGWASLIESRKNMRQYIDETIQLLRTKTPITKIDVATYEMRQYLD